MSELIQPAETPEPEPTGFGDYDVYSTEKAPRGTLVHIARTDGTTISFDIGMIEVFENLTNIKTDIAKQKLRLTGGAVIDLALEASASAKLKRHWISSKGYS